MQTETTGASPRHPAPAKNAAQQLLEHWQPSEKLLRVKRVAAYLDCGVATVWRRTNDDPTFPKPIKLSPRVTVWKLSELEDWISSRRVQGGTA